MKIRNPSPKWSSKTQQLKREYLKAHPIRRVACAVCGRWNTTLYRNEKGYYCKEHRTKTEAE